MLAAAEFLANGRGESTVDRGERAKMEAVIKVLAVCISLIYGVDEIEVCNGTCICPIGGGEM
jgi:hypothetical protein